MTSSTSYETARQVLLNGMALGPSEVIAYTNAVLRLAEPADEQLIPLYRSFRKSVNTIMIKCRAELHKLGILFEEWDLNEPGLAQQAQLSLFPDNAPRRDDPDF